MVSIGLKHSIIESVNNHPGLSENVRSYFWALNKRGFEVVICKGDDYCNFNSIAKNCSEDCRECSYIDDLYTPLIIDDLPEFLNLINKVNDLIHRNRNEINWLSKHSIISIWNNATEFDLTHPNKFLNRWIFMIDNELPIEHLGNYELGTLDIKGHERNIIVGINQTGTEQEAPFEFTPYLNDGSNELSLHELHSVRFGITREDEATVTSVQMNMLELPIKKLYFEIDRYFNSAYELFKLLDEFILFFNRVIDVNNLDELKVILIDIEESSSNEKRAADQMLFIQKLFTMLQSLDLTKYQRIISKLSPSSSFRFASLLSIKQDFCADFAQTYPWLFDIFEKYQQRSNTQRVLNSPMRMKNGGSMQHEVGSTFSLATFIFYLKQNGITMVRFPLSFPFRDEQRLNSTNEYILTKKMSLIQRIALELGVDERSLTLTDDGSCFYLDISKISVTRPILADVEKMFSRIKAES